MESLFQKRKKLISWLQNQFSANKSFKSFQKFLAPLTHYKINVPHDILRILFTGINTLSVTQYDTGISYFHLKWNANPSVLVNDSSKIL